MCITESRKTNRFIKIENGGEQKQFHGGKESSVKSL